MFGLFTRSAKNPAARRGVDQHGCFGKMPIHPDFIRHGVRAREVVAFENWVQEGVGLISRHGQGVEPSPLTAFPRHHLVMTGGEQDRTLGATLSASRDRSGRAYPFVVFRLADEPLFHEMQAAAPLVFDEFYQSSNDILDAPWRQEPLALLLDRIDGLASRECPRARRQLLERQIALLGDISMGRFWQEAFPGETPARQGVFEALFSALRSAARRGPGRITWGLRFPLAVGAHVLPTVVFWVQMVEAILEDRHWRAHYFWHDGDESLPGSLTLFFRPPAASLFLWLMPDTVAHSGLFDLRQVMNERSDVSCPPELARLLRDDEVSMLDLLYRAGRREVLL